MPIVQSKQYSLSAGLNKLTLPDANLTLIGIYFGGVNWLQIPTGEGTFATFVMGSNMTAKKPYIPVNAKMQGSNLNVNASGACTAYMYFGIPDAGALPLTNFNGVVEGAAPSAAGSGTLTYSFNSGEKAKGISVASTLGQQVEVDFATGTGANFDAFFIDQELPQPDSTAGFESKLPISLTVNYTVSGSAFGQFYVAIHTQ